MCVKFRMRVGFRLSQVSSIDFGFGVTTLCSEFPMQGVRGLGFRVQAHLRIDRIRNTI